MSVANKLFLYLPAPKKLVVILWLFLVVVVGLLGLSYMKIENLSAARAYVGGEGLWSEGAEAGCLRSAPVFHSHSEQDYRGYDHSAPYRCPWVNRRARLELESADPDMAIVRSGFIQGRNSPEDIDGMAKDYFGVSGIGNASRKP